MPALAAGLPGHEVDSWTTLHPEIQETIAMKGVFTTILGLIVLMIASIGVLNLMLMAVFEHCARDGCTRRPRHEGAPDHVAVPARRRLDWRGGCRDRMCLGVWPGACGGPGGDRFRFASGMGEVTALMGAPLSDGRPGQRRVQRGGRDHHCHLPRFTRPGMRRARSRRRPPYLNSEGRMPLWHLGNSGR